jgi:hypothetical protein
VSGRSPVDRGKQGTKRSVACDGDGIPLHLVAARAHDHDSPLLDSISENRAPAGTLNDARNRLGSAGSTSGAAAASAVSRTNLLHRHRLRVLVFLARHVGHTTGPGPVNRSSRRYLRTSPR